MAPGNSTCPYIEDIWHRIRASFSNVDATLQQIAICPKRNGAKHNIACVLLFLKVSQLINIRHDRYQIEKIVLTWFHSDITMTSSQTA